MKSHEPPVDELKPSSRKRRVERDRRELALEALRQFEKKGFAQTTVEEISEAAGYAPRTFFRYFGTKENAVFFDIEAPLSAYRELLDNPPPRGEGWSRVREVMLSNAMMWIESDPEFSLARIRLCHTEPALYSRLQDYGAEVEDMVRHILAVDRRQDPETDLVSGLTAAATVGAWRTALRVWLVEGGRLVDLLRAGVELIEAGLPER